MLLACSIAGEGDSIGEEQARNISACVPASC